MTTTRCLITIYLAFFIAAFAVAQGPANAASNVMFIFDASGSMKKSAGRVSRIAAAKQSMADMLKHMPDDVRLGLVLYGHRKSKDCSDIELASPIGADDAGKISATIAGVQVKGETPIAGALQYAARSFAPFKGQKNTIVLVTDGVEECRGDPCAAAKAIRDAGLDLKVNIVGFALTPKQRQAVTCVTDITGGKYYDAKDANALGTALQEVKQQLVVPELANPPVFNLLNSANGGHLETTPEREWERMITVKEPYNSPQYLHYTHDFPAEAVFSFKDRMKATFSQFNVYIPDAKPSHLKDFELSVSDDLFGAYRSLGKFTTNNSRLAASPYQPFTFPETTARFVKFRVISAHSGTTPVDIFPVQIVGKLVDGTAAPAPAPGPKPGETNLISTANGGKMISASFPQWAGVIAQAEDYIGTQYISYTHDLPTEAVFGFKDGRAAKFDRFAMLIPSGAGSAPKNFELQVADTAAGPFKSLGTFEAHNLLEMRAPYQEFSFPMVTAKFLKVRLLSRADGKTPVDLYPIKLFGVLE